jgi:hypothetical protein
MTDKRRFILAHTEARQRAIQAVKDVADGFSVVISPPTRNLEQNALLWKLLSAFSEQLEWPVNGKMVKLEPDEWKDILSAAFRQETARLAMGLNGGVVMLGLRTSKMSKREFSEFIEFIHSVASERQVKIT